MLSKTTDKYEGKVRVSFTISDKSTKLDIKDHLFLDFHGESILELTVNQVHIPVAEISFQKHRINIPSESLHPNSLNTVAIRF